jgi:hypothetical protein
VAGARNAARSGGPSVNCPSCGAQNAPGQKFCGPLLEEARVIFERLGATPWLERVTAVAPQAEEVPA